ncbi:MAG: ParB/RepB/Spo0J family partition protein [Microthrixaceae bacterium]|jgi:ParB/RepB/Spo0J family partition protein|nr:ParB/RepB/Spo0J family partition protein [Microthrixaceae bacterium]
MATNTKMKAAATPAGIPAETAAAHASEYDPAVPIDWIHPHPKNVRHDATADDELVESIRSQGLLEHLVVTPHPDPETGGYLLIAGHRRLDGLRRAGYTAAPAIIRHDLVDEADQVAAMLVENGRRRDLTPLEEAEGYGQLRFDFGWKPGAIAKASGHSTDTINRRLKLLKLDDKVKGRVDDGQLNIEDAIAIAELPAADQAHLSKAAADGRDFKWKLARVKDRIKKDAATATLVKKLDADGVPVVSMPKGVTEYQLNHTEHGLTRLWATYSSNPDDHQGCLAYAVKKDYAGADEVVYVCTNVPAHDEQLDADRAAREATRAAERADWEAEHEARRLASQMRIDAAVAAIKPGVKLDPAVQSLLNVGLRALLDLLDERGELNRLHDILGTPETDPDQVDYRARLVASAQAPVALMRAYAAAIGICLDDRLAGSATLDGDSRWEREEAEDGLAWLAHLEACGHHPTPVDEQHRARLTGTQGVAS